MVIEWGSTGSPFRVATPAATVIAGRLYGELGSLGQGLAASVSEAGFGVVARIGHPGDASHVYVIGDQQNSGMQFDASMTDFDSPAGALSGMLDRGNLPFVHAGPTVHLTTDGVRRQARVVSFDREPGSFQSFHGKTLRPGDGVFRLDIEPVQPESDATWWRRRTGRSLKHW